MRRVRVARRALSDSRCTCEHGIGCRSYNTGCDGDCDCSRTHDSFWVGCERTMAEIELHEATEIAKCVIAKATP